MKLETPTSGSELTAQAVAVLETRHKHGPADLRPRAFRTRARRGSRRRIRPRRSADLAAAAYEHLSRPAIDVARISASWISKSSAKAAAAT